MTLIQSETPAGEELPARPRRKLITPLTGGFAAVALAAAGFVGGVHVQKSHGSSSSSGSGRSGARAGGFPGGAAPTGATGAAGGAGGAPGGADSNATVGTVESISGDTLYVTGTDGTTVKVKVKSSSKITRNAGAGISAVHPGDSVTVQGSKASSGTVTATSVTAQQASTS